MICVNGTKINRSLKAWPQGTVATSSWFNTLDIGHQLRAAYQKSAWIKRIGHGAFIKDGDHISWEGALYALQHHLQLPIHVAAKTALELQGAAHFIQVDKNQSVILFGTPHTKLPSWFKKHDWQKKIHFTTTNLFLRDDTIGLIEKKRESIPLLISSRERALLELLYLIPQEQSLDEAQLIFESLRTLRPDLLQKLLQHCSSIKVKRLFLYLAEATNQPWLKDLDLSKINLGKGKRVIAGGGFFNSKYNISLPKIYSSQEQELEGA